MTGPKIIDQLHLQNATQSTVINHADKKMSHPQRTKPDTLYVKKCRNAQVQEKTRRNVRVPANLHDEWERNLLPGRERMINNVVFSRAGRPQIGRSLIAQTAEWRARHGPWPVSALPNITTLSIKRTLGRAIPPQFPWEFHCHLVFDRRWSKMLDLPMARARAMNLRACARPWADKRQFIKNRTTRCLYFRTPY